MKGCPHFCMLFYTNLDRTIPPMAGFSWNSKNKAGKVNIYVRLSEKLIKLLILVELSPSPHMAF